MVPHKSNIIILLLALIFFSFGISKEAFEGKELVMDLCQIENESFESGEVIIYEIFYNLNFLWLPAGEVVFKVHDKEDKYHMVATGRTFPSYEWFFKVRDYYESYVDKETLLPIESLRDVQEGKFEYYDHMLFDQDNRTVTFTAGKKKDTLRTESTVVESCMHDVLSIFYYMRNIDLSPMEEGDQFKLKVFLEKKVWPLDVEFLGKQPRKRIKGWGRQKTLLFSPETIAGTVFKEGDRMKIYISDDENRIPLLIESPVSVGSIKAVLKNHYGVRHREGIFKKKS